MKKKNKIIIQDTTLRDGEQTPRVAFKLGDKIKIVNGLIDLGVDVIEIGFPAASNEEKKIISKICRNFAKSKVKFCIFSRALEEDIVAAYEATKTKDNIKIQIVVPSSDSHIKYSVNKNKSQIIDSLKASIFLAKKNFKDIQFTAQDAPRADRKFLYKLIKIAIEGGAKTICLPDTVGACTPNEYQRLIKDIKKKFLRYNIIIAAHCHNDLGLATANTIAALEAGAMQLECTLNGLGERAGNTPLEEIIAILDLKKKHLLSDKINFKSLRKISIIIEKITGINIADNKPVLGKNVFMHASGMHQKAVLINKESFEILDANKYGFSGGKIIIGKLSGRAALKKILNKKNISLDNNALEKLIIAVKREAYNKKELNFPEIKKLIK